MAAAGGNSARHRAAAGARTGGWQHAPDAVRDFVFSMVADAEPAEGRSDVTGRGWSTAAAAPPDHPRLRG